MDNNHPSTPDFAFDPGSLDAERPRLSRFCQRFVRDRDTLDDLVQETLFEAIRHSDSLRDRTVWRSWLTGIARNVCLRYVQSRRREQLYSLDSDTGDRYPEPVDEETEEPLEILEKDERGRLLDGAMARLPVASRELLVQRYLQEVPVREISARLGISESHPILRDRNAPCLRQRPTSQSVNGWFRVYSFHETMRGVGGFLDIVSWRSISRTDVFPDQAEKR